MTAAAGQTVQKGTTVFYRPNRGKAGFTVRARVETVHRDGSVTVRSLFSVDLETGEDRFGYLGYVYRVDPSVLHLTAA